MTREPESDRLRVEYDAPSGTYRVTYDRERYAPSAAVVRAMTAVTGKEGTELEPLYEAAAVDLEALDAVVTTDADEGALSASATFRYADHRVTVSGDGRVEIAPPPERE